MGHAKKVVGGLIALALLAGGGYAVADANDLVPGILTLPEPVPTGLTPLPTTSPEPSASLGPAPTREGTAAAIGALLADPSLGGGAGAVVRDITSGEVLVSTDAERPRTIASTQKILSALAITDVLDAESTMKTTVVAGAPGEVVLVAGGDTLLATGPGDPTAVVGRAGLGDLAAQVAAAAPAGPLTVRLDASYAAGPPIPSSWNPADVSAGYTRRVTMIGLADNRPQHGLVPRQESVDDSLEAFVAALVAHGREATASPPGPAPAKDAKVLGSITSAPIAEVLGHGMDESDNAILENLSRQAIVASGGTVPADGNTGPFVLAGLAKAGIDTSGTTIHDASGLGPGQLVPLTTVDHVLATGLGGKHPGMRRVLAELPTSGLTGTLATRFNQPDTAAVAGVPRAKTGTLRGISALAGLTTDADGRLLSFVVVADHVPESYEGTLAARATLDRFAAALTRCGCH